eukprot:m.180727 g.180727  ORF g.180727 m.180727 type:complete len:330 (-) comp15084_c0_seq1:665-1654(-)
MRKRCSDLLLQYKSPWPDTLSCQCVPFQISQTCHCDRLQRWNLRHFLRSQQLLSELKTTFALCNLRMVGTKQFATQCSGRVKVVNGQLVLAQVTVHCTQVTMQGKHLWRIVTEKLAEDGVRLLVNVGSGAPFSERLVCQRQVVVRVGDVDVVVAVQCEANFEGAVEEGDGLAVVTHDGVNVPQVVERHGAMQVCWAIHAVLDLESLGAKINSVAVVTVVDVNQTQVTVGGCDLFMKRTEDLQFDFERLIVHVNGIGDVACTIVCQSELPVCLGEIQMRLVAIDFELHVECTAQSFDRRRKLPLNRMSHAESDVRRSHLKGCRRHRRRSW